MLAQSSTTGDPATSVGDSTWWAYNPPKVELEAHAQLHLRFAISYGVHRDLSMLVAASEYVQSTGKTSSHGIIIYFYQEAIHFLYASNTFAVSDPDVLYYLPTIFLPQRMNVIQSLQLKWPFQGRPPLGSKMIFDDWSTEGSPERLITIKLRGQEDERQKRWTIAWHNIASMQNLRDLKVKLSVEELGWRDIDDENAAVLFQPIRKVVRPDSFTLTIPFLPVDRESRRRYGAEEEADIVSFPPDGVERTDVWDTLPCTISRARVY